MSEHPRQDDNETTPRYRRCPVCGTAFIPVGRQTYDTNACRQIAYRRRHYPPIIASVPPARRRRDITVYLCTECDTRYLGEQWCHDCNRPCVRLGSGGSCPHCDQPVVVEDLIPIRVSR